MWAYTYAGRSERRRDGSVVGYLQLAHNHRVKGGTQARVLLNLGREDELDVEGCGALRARSAATWSGPTGSGRWPRPPKAICGSATPARWAPPGRSTRFWRRLGIDRALKAALRGRRHRNDVERTLFALVANRAIAPASKLAAAERATHDAAIPGLGATDDDRAYRAMDVLATADAEGAVQEAVFFGVADLLNLEIDLLFFDTTSTCFEIEYEDEGGEEQGMRRFGHSKDHRPDRPQVVVGLAVTRTGTPVRVWVWPGNTADASVIEEVKADLAGWRLGRAIWIVDRGIASEENLRYLRRGGGHWIAGMRMRAGEEVCEAALARPGRYRTVRDNLRVKEVRVGEGDTARRFIVCHNPEEEAKDRARRERAVERIVTARADRSPAGPRGPLGHRPRAGRVCAARPPLLLALSPPDEGRPAEARSGQDRGRGEARRQVPAQDLRS